MEEMGETQLPGVWSVDTSLLSSFLSCHVERPLGPQQGSCPFFFLPFLVIAACDRQKARRPSI